MLVISYLGYETQEIKASQGKLNIVLNESSENLIGAVATNEAYSSKRSLWKRVKTVLK